MTHLSVNQLNDFIEKHPHEDIADVGGWLEWPDWAEPAPERYIYDLSMGNNICNEPLPRKHQTVLCMDTYEHILDPVRASQNLIKSLNPGGWLFLTTLFAFRYHTDHISKIDTYRYTDEVLKVLFKDLEIENCWMEDETVDGAQQVKPEIRVTLIGRNP